MALVRIALGHGPLPIRRMGHATLAPRWLACGLGRRSSSCAFRTAGIRTGFTAQDSGTRDTFARASLGAAFTWGFTSEVGSGGGGFHGGGFHGGGFHGGGFHGGHR